MRVLRWDRRGGRTTDAIRHRLHLHTPARTRLRRPDTPLPPRQFPAETRHMADLLVASQLSRGPRIHTLLQIRPLQTCRTSKQLICRPLPLPSTRSQQSCLQSPSHQIDECPRPIFLQIPSPRRPPRARRAPSGHALGRLPASATPTNQLATGARPAAVQILKMRRRPPTPRKRPRALRHIRGRPSCVYRTSLPNANGEKR